MGDLKWKDQDEDKELKYDDEEVVTRIEIYAEGLDSAAQPQEIEVKPLRVESKLDSQFFLLDYEALMYPKNLDDEKKRKHVAISTSSLRGRSKSRILNPLNVIGNKSQVILWRQDYRTSTAYLTTDVSFKKIRKNVTSFHIWRVQGTNLFPIPRDEYGLFYDHECYVMFASTEYGKPILAPHVHKEIKGRIEYHVHFWLGKNSKAEQAGIAAYKTVELDTCLNCTTVQHREVQGSESARFKSYFTKGIKIVSGEYNCDFEEDEFEPKLYRIKGRRAPYVVQLPYISWEFFNSEDIFLLHTEKTLYIWLGRATNTIQRLRATKTILELREEQNIPNVIFVDDGYEKTLPSDDRKVFHKFLPAGLRHVVAFNEEHVDSMEIRSQRTMRLYQCADNGGKYRVTEVKNGPLKQKDLVADDTYILDQGYNGVWIWVGKRASEKERFEAMRNARGFVKKKKYSDKTPVHRCTDGFEPLEFKLLFRGWRDSEENKVLDHNKITVFKITKYDAQTMADRPALAAKSQLIDDGAGSLQTWRVKSKELVEIPKRNMGTFFLNDCYVIYYEYKSPGGTKRMIYYWLGIHSSDEEQRVAAEKAKQIDKELCQNEATIIRVASGCEPTHFLQLYKGRLRIFHGRGSDFDVSGTNSKTPNYYLLHVQGNTTYNAKATQVQVNSGMLNSNNCFVLRKANVFYIWCGQYSTGDNREVAKGFVGADFEIILEGSEHEEFWNTIGGKHNYEKEKIVDRDDKMPARLYECTFSGGVLRAEEILFFSQENLAPETLMLVDANDTIYLWTGEYSPKEQKNCNVQIALQYLMTDPAGRDLKSTVVLVRQGCEPPTFTGFFGSWNFGTLKQYQSYEEIRKSIEKEYKCTTSITSRDVDSFFDDFDKYPIPLLKGPAEKLPSTVDLLRKELHLTYDDFVTVFNMEYKEFEKFPLWKQKELKKNVGLF